MTEMDETGICDGGMKNCKKGGCTELDHESKVAGERLEEIERLKKELEEERKHGDEMVVALRLGLKIVEVVTHHWKGPGPTTADEVEAQMYDAITKHKERRG